MSWFLFLCDVIRPEQNVAVGQYHGFQFAYYKYKEKFSRIIFKTAVTSSRCVGVPSNLEENQLNWCTLNHSIFHLSIHLYLTVLQVKEKKKMLYAELKKNNPTNQTLFLSINLILHQCKTKSIRLFYHEGDAHICCKWPPSCNTK